MSKLIHMIVLAASLLDHHAHLHVAHDFELVLANINPRRVIARS